jgi:ubiquinone/menaquinone biosynthesis C-methylase UbiE
MTSTTEHRELDLAFEPTRTGILTTIRIEGSTIRLTQEAPDHTDLPFPDGSFARVVCRHGLQLLADRRRALREMHRVLAHGGEVDIEVPGPIERNPPFADLADALERTEDRHKAVRIRWLFSMPEPDDLRGALADAGFEGIRIEVAHAPGGDHHAFAMERNRGRAIRA